MHRRPATGWILALSLCGGATSHAQDFGPIRADLAEGRAAVESLEAKYLRPAMLERTHAITARVSDGQLFYLTGDYERASMVLLDVAERRGAQGHPGYGDALFYLADSLFHLRNFDAAADWFEKVTRHGSEEQRQRAVGRLLEIAVATRDEARARRYLQDAQRLLGGDADPALVYAVGKFHYLRDEVEEARAAFARVPAAHADWFRARHHLGVCLVRLRRLDEALSVFAEVVSAADTTGGLTEAQRGAVDESRLALGRIHYEREEFGEAVAAYAAVPRQSAAFDDALFESVWISIKQGEFEHALRKLEIQLISQPEVIKGPDARLLQGKLLIMLGRYPEAVAAFREVLFEFEPIQAEMKTVIRRNKGDLIGHFNTVIGRGIADFDLTSFLPPRAAEFADSDAEADRALLLVSDLAAQRRDVDEMQRTIRRLEVALAADSRMQIFPKLSEGWLKSAELRARMVQARAAMLDALATRLEARPPEYQALREARREAGARYAAVPRSAIAVLAREGRVDDELRRVDKELFKLDLAIRGLQAQLTAITRYVQDQARLGGLTQKDRRTLAQVDLELAQARALREELHAVGERIEAERIAVGVGDYATARDERARLRYVTAIEAEVEWLRERGVGLPADLAATARDIDARAARFQRSARELVDDRVVDIRRQIDREKRNILGYEGDLAQYQTQAETLGGAIAARSFLHVLGRIDELVLESDVGLVDVAWKQKQDRSDRISRLLDKKAADLEALDANYREVRGE